LLWAWSSLRRLWSGQLGVMAGFGRCRAGCLGSGPAFTWATGAMTSVFCSCRVVPCIFGFCGLAPATHGNPSSCRAGCLGSGPAFTWATGAMTSMFCSCRVVPLYVRFRLVHARNSPETRQKLVDITPSSLRAGCLGSGLAFTWATGSMTSVLYSCLA
jgi:hypothetical protein